MRTPKRYILLKEQILELGRECLDSNGVRYELEVASQVKRRLDSLETGRYRIAVIGEVSAGKSTLINTLIGMDLLPRDVRQCTSAIIEISHGSSTSARVVFADGSEQELPTGEDSINTVERFAGLLGVTKIPDQFRGIPTGLIDSFAIARKPVPSLSLLEDKSGLYLADKKDTIDDYIQNWALPSKIPVEVYVTVSFDNGMRPLTIVDTPGVNAVGGIQDKTRDYLVRTDTVMITCSIKRAELTPFQDLVRKCVQDFSAENIFVILTHSGVCCMTDRNRLLTEARHLMPYVPPERIIPVDSVLKSLERDARIHGLSKVLKDEDNADTLAHLRASRFEEEANFLDLVRRESNFDAIEYRLMRLGRQVPIMLAERALDSMAPLLSQVPKEDTKMRLENRHTLLRKDVEEHKFLETGIGEFVNLFRDRAPTAGSQESDGGQSVEAVVEHFRDNIVSSVLATAETLIAEASQSTRPRFIELSNQMQDRLSAETHERQRSLAIADETLQGLIRQGTEFSERMGVVESLLADYRAETRRIASNLATVEGLLVKARSLAESSVAELTKQMTKRMSEEARERERALKTLEQTLGLLRGQTTEDLNGQVRRIEELLRETADEFNGLFRSSTRDYRHLISEEAEKRQGSLEGLQRWTTRRNEETRRRLDSEMKSLKGQMYDMREQADEMADKHKRRERALAVLLAVALGLALYPYVAAIW